MTAQINDIFRAWGQEYELIGISQGEIFDPSIFGIQPDAASTACYRGYLAVFAMDGQQLMIEALHVSLYKEERLPSPCKPRWRVHRIQGPPINGVMPTESASELFEFNNSYQGLCHPLNYTGGLLIAQGFFEELYIHMGFQPPWKYETVYELIFKDGLLQEQIDRSEQMAVVRERSK